MSSCSHLFLFVFLSWFTACLAPSLAYTPSSRMADFASRCLSWTTIPDHCTARGVEGKVADEADCAARDDGDNDDAESSWVGASEAKIFFHVSPSHRSSSRTYRPPRPLSLSLQLLMSVVRCCLSSSLWASCMDSWRPPFGSVYAIRDGGDGDDGDDVKNDDRSGICWFSGERSRTTLSLPLPSPSL